MPFGQAKQYVEKNLAPEIKEQGNILMNVAYVGLLKNFDSHTNKASKYLAHANYSGHNRDRTAYFLQIRKSTDIFLEKNGTYEEFLKYIAKTDVRSDKLHETIGEKIKQQENEKFIELSKKNINLVREGKFDDAIINMLDLNMHLSPFNRTDKSGNIGESYLRLDKKIEDKVNNFKEQKRLCSQLFVKGNVFETKNAKIYIQGAIKDGKVKYADIKGKSPDQFKDNDYKTISWLTLLRKFPPGKFELKKGGKEIDIKTDPKLAESKAHIAELKMLKQINFFYSGGLDKFAKSPEEKKLLKNALEENLATMGLYFDRNADGIVTPTKVYKMLPQSVKVEKLVGMIQGFQRTRMRMKLEQDVGKIDKEKNPSQHRFLKAEIDFRNGLHLPAYTKFKKFINDNKSNSDEVVKKQVKHAKERLRRSSFYVINLAQRYSMACVQEPHGEKQKFHLRDGLRKKVISKLTKVFSQLRESMQSGKAADLDQAYAMLKDKPEGGLDVKIVEFGAIGNTEYNFLENHYSFVKTMITSVTVIVNDDRQEAGLTALGDVARKDKFRGGARILYEEQMKRKLIMKRRELMKNPKYREQVRQRFVKLKLNSEQKTLSSTQVAKLLMKTALDSNKPYAHSRSVLDDLKTLKQFEETNIGFVDTAKKGVDAVVGISNGHFNSIKRTLDTLDIPANKKISKYEDFNPFAKTAGLYRRAVYDAGGLKKYMKLPLEKKKILFNAAKIKILLAQHENIEHKINVNAYVKGVMSEEGSMSQLTNPVAYKYNDAYDPNNELFNISDEGWDFVESLVGEIPIMAASGGVGNVAAIGVKQGAKYAAKKLAQRAILGSKTFTRGVRGAAFASDLVVSEAVDRGMRYILRGEDPPMDIAQLLAHSLGTYGSMKYASKGGQRLLSGVAEKGMVGKIASHAISTAVIEAPCMMAVNNLFGQAEGTMLEQYGRALGTMLASKGSMSMLHSSTGRVMMKAEQDYDIKDSVNKIPDQQKRDLLNKMINKGEINVDQLGTIMSENLNYKQIRKIRGLINNPKSIKFLLAYKYAKSHGVENQDLTREYDSLVSQLRGEGLSRADVENMLSGVEKKVLTKTPESNAKKAESFLIKHKDKIKDYFKDKSIKQAFILFMTDFQGSFETFRAKHPKLAKILPKDLLKIKFIPIPQLASVLGASFKSVNELSPRKPLDQIKLDSLEAKLKAVGLDHYAELIKDPKANFMSDNGNSIKTIEQRNKEVARLLALDGEIKMETDFLRDCGLETHATKLENYKDGSDMNLKERLSEAKRLGDEIETLQKSGLLTGNLNPEQVLDLIHFKSAAGQNLKVAIINHKIASRSGDPINIQNAFKDLKTELIKHFPNITPQAIMTLSGLSGNRFIGQAKFNINEFESFCKTKEDKEFLIKLKEQLGNDIQSMNSETLTKLANADADVVGTLTPAQKLKVFLEIKTRKLLINSSFMFSEQKAAQMKSLTSLQNLFADGYISKDVSYNMIGKAMKANADQIIPRLNILRTIVTDVKTLKKLGLKDCADEIMNFDNVISRVDGSPLRTLEQRLAYVEKIKNLSSIELKWYKNRPPKLPPEGHPDHEKIAYKLKNYTADFISNELIPHLAKQGMSHEAMIKKIHAWQTKGSKAQMDVLLDVNEGYNIAGKYREMPVLVGNYQCPHNQYVPKLIQAFDAQLTKFSTEIRKRKNTMSEAKYEQAVVQYAAHAMQRFVDIHPMRDGNGRTARALYEFIVVKHLGSKSKYKKYPMGIHPDNGEPTGHPTLSALNGKIQKRNYPNADFRTNPTEIKDRLKHENLDTILDDLTMNDFRATIMHLTNNPGT